MKELSDKEVIRICDSAFKAFGGNMTEMQAAIGALMLGRNLGWRPLLLMLDRRSFSKYEKLLGIDFRERLPEAGPLAHKSVAWRTVQHMSNFWKAVKGETKGVRSPEVTRE